MKNTKKHTQTSPQNNAQNNQPRQSTLPAPIQQAMAHYQDLKMFELTPDADGNLRPTISSLNVAKRFGKRHDHVLRAIQDIINAPNFGEVNNGYEIIEDFNRRNFAEIFYTDKYGRQQPCYDLTRDGFTFLAMGFTGKQADLWKINIVTCFNKMEAELLKTREEALLQRAAQHQKLLVAQAAREAAQVFCRLTPMQKACFTRAVNYRQMGLNAVETGRILGTSADTVRRALKAARHMGLEV